MCQSATWCYQWHFNISLPQERVPTYFKTATIDPEPKRSAVSSLNECHPLVLTTILMKCFGKLVLQPIKTTSPAILDSLFLNQNIQRGCHLHYPTLLVPCNCLLFSCLEEIVICVCFHWETFPSAAPLIGHTWSQFELQACRALFNSSLRLHPFWFSLDYPGSLTVCLGWYCTLSEVGVYVT